MIYSWKIYPLLLEFTGGCDFKGVEITQVWLKDKRYKGGGIAKRRKPSLPSSVVFFVVKQMATMRVGQQKKVNPRSHYANSSRHIFSGTVDPIQGVYQALSEWTNAFYQ